MLDEYEWDENKRLSNYIKHDLDFTELESFEWDTARTTSNLSHGELRLVAVGYIGTRLHTVVYIERGSRKRIISFRIASNGERRDYAQT